MSFPLVSCTGRGDPVTGFIVDAIEQELVQAHELRLGGTGLKGLAELELGRLSVIGSSGQRQNKVCQQAPIHA